MLFTEKSVTIYTEHSCFVMKTFVKTLLSILFSHHIFVHIIHFAYYTFVRCQQIYNEMYYIND